MKESAFKVEHSGRSVHGRLWVPDKEGRCPLIIFSHGYNGSMDDFGKAAEFFACQGYVAATISFCGGSTSDPSSFPSESMSVLTEADDLQAVVDELSGRDDVDPFSVFLFGGSQGGLVSALTAAKLGEGIRGLILLYPALCIEDDWKKKYPNPEDMPEKLNFWDLTLGRKYCEDAHKLQIFETIGAYEGPVLIMHGSDDEVVPISYSEKARKVYPNARLLPFALEKHGFCEDNNRRVTGAAYLFCSGVTMDL